MTEPQLGSIVIRTLADEITPREIRVFLKALRDRPELRARAHVLGTFTDASPAQRRVLCGFMVDILLGWVEPKATHREATTTNTWPYVGTHDLERAHLKTLTLSQKWYRHALRKDDGHCLGFSERTCRISQELFDILAALEDLWGIPERYVKRAARTAKDFRDDELVLRRALARR